MIVKRLAAAALLLLTFSCATATLASAAAAGSPTNSTLSGLVTDDVGRALEGAEVLILAPEGQRGTVLRAVSNASGHFIVGALTPGVYRVAAIKSGYIAALGHVNTLLRGSVDLVLHPIPKSGEAGSQEVQGDLSWALRVPPRSILKQIEAEAIVESHDTGGASVAAARVPDSVRGEVDHMVALGAWRGGSSGPASSLAGNETRMRLVGTLGERGAIQVEGRHGSLDSTSHEASSTSVSRAASDLDVGVSYDTSDDTSVAMRAFYSTGALEVGDPPGLPGRGARQGQRSWGYEGQFHKQVDGASRVAVQVGFHDADLEIDQGVAAAWDRTFQDASNRAVGAEGQYESFAGDGHLLRFGVRAQLLSISAPTARIGRADGDFALDGTTGWSLLLDAEDQWSITGPVALSYGLAVRQGLAGPLTTSVTPSVGASWTSNHFRARAELTYLATADLSGGAVPPSAAARRWPLGYGVELEAPVGKTVTVHGTASYVPLRANVWEGTGDAKDLEDLYVTDGLASDQFVAVGLDRAAGDATVSLRLARGRAEGALAPAFDKDVPVVLLSDGAIIYESIRLGTTAPRAGSTLTAEYRSIREQSTVTGIMADEAVQTVELAFAQQLVRLAGGRASCRLLLAARGAVGPAPRAPEADPAEARRFAALYQRVGAGVSLAF